jgi:YVTN family beta-propeller protein
MAVDFRPLRGYPGRAQQAPLSPAVCPRTLACLLFGGLALTTTGLIRSSLPQPTIGRSFAGVPGAAVAAVRDNPATPNSGPIALSPDDKFVWMVSPDDNQVVVVRVEGDANQVVQRIPVGKEPAGVALSPRNTAAYVTNSVDGTVSVIIFPPGDPTQAKVFTTVKVGTEPFGVLVTPDGSKVYVANSNSGDVSVISTLDHTVLQTIPNVGYQPHGLAFAGGRLYVTQLLAQLRNNGRPVERNEGEDDGKEGRITVINTATDTVEQTIALNPLTPFQVGFKSNGSTLDRIPPRNNAAGQPVFDFDTGAFPNLLWSLGIKNGRAYVPAVGASPNGPFRFNVNCQSVLSVVNLGSGVEEAGKTINMNKGLGAEKVGTKLFLSNPSAIQFKHNANEGYVVLSGIDQIVRVTLAADGIPSVGAPNPVRIFTTPSPNGDYLTRGKNPRDIVINSADTRAYVACQLSKDVAVIDLKSNTRLANIPTGDLPPLNSFSGQLLRGKQLFNSSIGPEGTQDNSKAPAGRMSDFGWGNCASCHPDGRADGVTWMFPDGPRQTISLDGTFDHRFQNGRVSLDHIRILNWSAVRDEVQDFELNTRGVFGGQGLIRDGRPVINLINPDGSGEANTGRDPDLDSLAVFQAYGIRTPIAPPISSTDFFSGADLFGSAGCTSCHSGRQWTNSIRNFTPPPKQDRTGAQVLITNGQLVGFLRKVGTFDPTKFNEVRANANVNGAVPPANGDLGLNPPSLLGLAASAPYFHSGAARSLEEVMEHVAHRTAGSPGRDLFTDPANRALMVKFLRSLDSTKPFFAGP